MIHTVVIPLDGSVPPCTFCGSITVDLDGNAAECSNGPCVQRRAVDRWGQPVCPICDTPARFDAERPMHNFRSCTCPSPACGWFFVWPTFRRRSAG